MLTPSEVRELIDYQKVNDDDEPGLLKLLDHFASLYSTDSSKEAIEETLRAAGFDETRLSDTSSMWTNRRYPNMTIFYTPWNGGFNWDYRVVSSVGEMMHLIAAEELAIEAEEV